MPRSPSSSAPTAGPTAAPARALPWILLIGGGVGLAAAFALILERIALYEDPDHVPACSINPILNCGSVMTTDQAQVLGFPNPLLGIVGFSTVTATGAILLSGGALGRRAWPALLAGATAGLLFVHWLIYQSLYVIGALCPYCMAVWVVTVAVFWYVLVHALSAGHLGRRAAATRPSRVLAAYHSVPITLWHLIVIGLILVRFWSYWRTLLV